MSMIQSFKAGGNFLLMLCGACRDARDHNKDALSRLHNDPIPKNGQKAHLQRAVEMERHLNWTIDEYDKMYSLFSALERMAHGCDVEITITPHKDNENG